MTARLAHTPADEYPPQVLREYALLADGERGILVGPRGDYVWMCAPRWDSDAVFAALLGGGGGYAITPVGRFVWGGYYEQGSLIWRSRWVTETGIVECREALAFPGDTHRAVVLRRVIATQGPARLRVHLDPRAGFGSSPWQDLACDAGHWTGRSAGLQLRWSGGSDARPAGGKSGDSGLTMELSLPPGEQHDFVLEVSDQTLPDRPVDAGVAWDVTEHAWPAAVPELRGSIASRDARHSYAVLRGLTSTGGGMVAAATTSLPERAEKGRNYDYRYVWIRDQCYTGEAIAAAGPHPLLDDAVRFVTERLLEDGPQLKPAYTTTGGPVPDQRPLNLAGYPGGHDIIGNWVNKQFQLDAFGESLLLFSAAAGHDRLGTESWRAAEVAAAAIADRWTEPDAGIWEIDNQAWTHSRMICAAGLRAIAGAGASLPVASTWLTLADRIVADTAANATHPAGRWQRSQQDPALDASLLLLPLRGAVPANDPRSVATLDSYLAELTEDGYAYRFRQDPRPLADAEGAFLLCGFLVALAQHQQGRAVEANRWFERNRAACGPPALFTEEFDIGQRQLRGNLPQAFVHALMFEASMRLAGPQDGEQ